MNDEIRKEKTRKIVGTFVLVSFIVPIVFLIYRIVVSSNELPTEIYTRTRSDYVLMLVQCILGVFALMLPTFVSRKYKVQIPTNMYMLYVVFLYGAIFLGEVRNFYYNVPHWDTILHTFSGAMIGALGFSFVSLMNKEENIPLNLTPFFVAFFAFCFAVTLGVIWEIYEFTFDGILGLNMQKFALEDGTGLIGRAALSDTMKDLIVDAIGAFVMSVIGYISLKYKKGWVEKLLIKKEE